VLGFMATTVTVDPLPRNLHGDPRFQALLAKMKLDAWKRRVVATSYPDDALAASPSRICMTSRKRWRRRINQAICTPDFFLFDCDRRLAYHGQFDGSKPGNNIPLTGIACAEELPVLPLSDVR
jgi:hypothetical protein